MSSYIGIDPGVIGNAIVKLDSEMGLVNYCYTDTSGIEETLEWYKETMPKVADKSSVIFIEDYATRQFAGKHRMEKLVGAIEGYLKDLGFEVRLVNNAGVKAIITPEMMKKLGLWQFDQGTHHNDLRSAARILLYGLVKKDKETGRKSETNFKLASKLLKEIK